MLFVDLSPWGNTDAWNYFHVLFQEMYDLNTQRIVQAKVQVCDHSPTSDLSRHQRVQPVLRWDCGNTQLYMSRRNKLEMDACGVCAGGNRTCTDCLGEVNGGEYSVLSQNSPMRVSFVQINGFMQERRNSIVNALELRLLH